MIPLIGRPFKSVCSIYPIYLEEAPIWGKDCSGIPNKSSIYFSYLSVRIFIKKVREALVTSVTNNLLVKFHTTHESMVPKRTFWWSSCLISGTFSMSHFILKALKYVFIWTPFIYLKMFWLPPNYSVYLSHIL